MSTDLPDASMELDRIEQLEERISELEQELENAHRLRLAIERNNRLFEALLSASQDGVALTRLDGTVIRSFRSFGAQTPAELTGMSVFDLVHDEDADRLRECYRQIGERRAVQVSSEIRLPGRDGASLRVTGTITDMLDDPAVQAIVLNYRIVRDPSLTR